MDAYSEQAGDLHQEFERILSRTELLAQGHAIQYRELVRIADYLAQIRVLLTELKQAQDGPGEEKGGQIPDFITRFTRLEGRIKEIRNDHHLSSPAGLGREDGAGNRERRII